MMKKTIVCVIGSIVAAGSVGVGWADPPDVNPPVRRQIHEYSVPPEQFRTPTLPLRDTDILWLHQDFGSGAFGSRQATVGNVRSALIGTNAYDAELWATKTNTAPTMKEVSSKIEALGAGGSAPEGTVISTGTPAVGAVPRHVDASGTNTVPSTVTIDETGKVTAPGGIDASAGESQLGNATVSAFILEWLTGDDIGKVFIVGPQTNFLAMPGLSDVWTNQISGVITQRLTSVSGIIVTKEIIYTP